MKSWHRLLAVTIGLLAFFPAAAADRLAVTEPVALSGVGPEEVAVFWSMLESSVRSDQYQVISRAALKQMLTEIGLVENSDLVDPDSAQKAALGRLKGVKYLLVSEIGRFGTQFNCTLKILDASTGEIDQHRTANLRVRNLDELSDHLESTLRTLLSDDKALPALALLQPNFSGAAMPEYLTQDFSTQLESALLNAGFSLQNLQSVTKILNEHQLGNLTELEPKTYRRVGELLEVSDLIQPTITRCEVIATPFEVRQTGAKGTYYVGYLEGHVRIVSTHTGKVVASIPFDQRIDFRQLGPQITRDWVQADYGKYLVRSTVVTLIAPQVKAALSAAPQMTGR